MEAPGKSCFPEGFTPLEIPVVAVRNEWRNISNGVNIVSYCALASAHYRPVRDDDLASMFTYAERSLESLVLNSALRILHSAILCLLPRLWQSSPSRLTFYLF